jgi:serine/threonine protein kinase/Flp pilus assembly protein TadD
MIAEFIAHYRIIRKLGAGGMAEVYLAQDTKLDRKVAIKVLLTDVGFRQNAKDRLIREAQAAARLDHPNICAIYEVDEADAITYIVMQYIEGETLAETLRNKPLDLSAVLNIAEQAGEALAEAHAQGIIHRDIKPQNIMLTSRNQVKMLDFGLAKQMHSADSVETEAKTVNLLSTPGAVIGTVPYMSPEQVRGEHLDVRSDIFSLGVVLYEMFAGKHPFLGDNAAVTSSRILLAEPFPTEQFLRTAPPELQRILGKSLNKDKEQRYQTTEDFLADVRKFHASLPAGSDKYQSQKSQDSTITQVATGRLEPESLNGTSPARRVISTAVRNRWPLLALLLAAILLAVGINKWFFTEKGNSIAILPFTYVSDDPQFTANPDREYLSDGFTESIINSLSQLPNLKVIARSSVFRYKGREPDMEALGRELNVRSMLVGRIKQQGDQIWISAALTDIQENRRLWGKQYTGRTADIQTIQIEIARDISEALRLKLTGADQKQLARSYTDNGEAYQAYLKGRYYWNKRTDEGFKQAISYFLEAIDKDPNYALAYTGLADCYTLRSDYGFLPPMEGYALAKGAVTVALRSDSSLAEAHTSLASIKAVTDWDWQGAENEYRRAIELNPNYPTAHHWYAAQLLLMGRLDQALSEIKKAQQLDPFSLGINKDYAVILLFSRRYDEAIEQSRKTLTIDPGFLVMSTYMAQAYELKQLYPEAIAVLEKAHAAAPSDGEITYGLGQAYALAGKKAEAVKILTELNQPSRQNLYLPKEAALLYSLLGDKDKAVSTLEKAYENHNISVAEIKMDPRFDHLRSDERVVDLLRRLGLPQ